MLRSSVVPNASQADSIDTCRGFAIDLLDMPCFDCKAASQSSDHILVELGPSPLERVAIPMLRVGDVMWKT